MKLGFGFDQLLIDVLEQAIGAVGKRIMNRFINCIVRIAASAVDVSDGMARGAGDASLRRWMFLEVVIRIIEGATEERHDVVAARAPARGSYIAVAFQGYFAGLAHAEKVSLVVERSKMVSAVKPALIIVLVTFQAIIVHHQSFGRNKVSGSGARQ